jgi:hypothetical protein
MFLINKLNSSNKSFDLCQTIIYLFKWAFLNKKLLILATLKLYIKSLIVLLVNNTCCTFECNFYENENFTISFFFQPQFYSLNDHFQIECQHIYRFQNALFALTIFISTSNEIPNVKQLIMKTFSKEEKNTHKLHSSESMHVIVCLLISTMR